MKRKIERIKYAAIFILLLMPFFTIDAAAKTTIRVSSGRSKSVWSIIIPIIAVVVIAIVKAVLGDKANKQIGKGNLFSNNKSDNFFYNSNDSMNMTNTNGNIFDPRLSDSENMMLRQFESQAKLRHPDPVSSTCPNCGAPISISDKAFCPYCRSNVVNKTVYNNQNDKKPKPISPENYNPKRYYDENVTGYEHSSMGSSSDDDRNCGYSFADHGNNSGFFYNGDDNSYPPSYNNYDDNYANRNYNGYYRGQKYNGDNNNR